MEDYIEQLKNHKKSLEVSKEISELEVESLQGRLTVMTRQLELQHENLKTTVGNIILAEKRLEDALDR